MFRRMGLILTQPHLHPVDARGPLGHPVPSGNSAKAGIEMDEWTATNLQKLTRKRRRMRVPLSARHSPTNEAHPISPHLRRGFSLSLGLVISLALAACGSEPPPDESPAAELSQRTPLPELQRMKRKPLACDAQLDCPTGTHCDEEAGRCDWKCFADSDCGNDHTCDLQGRCVDSAEPAHGSLDSSGLRTSTVSSQLAADHPTCTAMPLQVKLAALADLTPNPQTCDDDSECPCGAYCSSANRCRFDCTYDSPNAGPFCSPGKVCSTEGRCITSGGSDDPAFIVRLEPSTDLAQGNTLPGPVSVPMELRVRAVTAADVLRSVNATVRIEVLPHEEEPNAPAPQVRCAPGAPLATSCEIPAGWQFGADANPLRSSPRPFWIELPQTNTTRDWSVRVSSEWSDTPQTIMALARPRVAVPETGYFTGTVSWPQPGGEPMVLPVTAEVTNTEVALFEPSRLLLSGGQVVLDKDHARLAYYPWLMSDQAAQPPQAAYATLDLISSAFDPETRSLTGELRLTLGNGPAPTTLALALDYAGTGATACTAAPNCASGSYCNLEIGRCLPGSSPASELRPDGTPVSSELASALRTEWTPAVDTMRAANPSVLGGDDLIGMERAMCFNPSTPLVPGRFGSSNGTSLANDNPSHELRCVGPSNSETPQQTFPFSNRTTGVTVDTNGVETFNLLDACLADLAIAPTGPSTPTNLLTNRQCVNVARFFLAMSAPIGSPSRPQPARHVLEHALTRQWATLHAMVSRLAVQENEFDEAIGGQNNPPMQVRLAGAVDAVEKGLRALVRNRRTTEAEANAAQRPEYRTLGRPVAHWTFNQNLDGNVPDTETGMQMYFIDLPEFTAASQMIVAAFAPWAVCGNYDPIALPQQHFTVSAYISVDDAVPNYQIFSKQSATDRFSITAGVNQFDFTTMYIHASLQRLVDSQWLTSGSVSFALPNAAGFYSIISDGDKVTLRRAWRNRGVIETSEQIGALYGNLQWGSPAPLNLYCKSPQAPGIAKVDELAFWDRPITLEMTRAWADAYLSPTNAPIPSVNTLPPRDLALAATDEQAQGLPVHLVDSLAAQMELLSAYVRSERSSMYSECSNSSMGPVRTNVLSRVGRAMRLSTLIENDARDLVALAGASAPWLPRYQDASKLLAGKRAEVLTQLGMATSCENPLGITNDDLPLFHGRAPEQGDRFFASSRFLTTEAQKQVDRAQTELNLARNAWQAQRASSFQNEVLDPAEKLDRMLRIEKEYDGALRRLCGNSETPSNTVLEQFRRPVNPLTPTNCFLKLEKAECANAASLSVGEVPAHCLRGEIGEQILAIQVAEIDARNAQNASERAVAQYDSEMEYCTRRDSHHEQSRVIREKHRAHMIKLRAERRQAAFWGGFAKAATGMLVGGLAGQPTIAMSSWLDAAGLIAGQFEQDAAEDEADAESAHQLVMAARAEALDLEACFHGANNQMFAINAARDVQKRVFHDSKGAAIRLESLQAEIRALLTQAEGEIELERKMVRVLPHHHFWLDDHINAYRAHFRYAQRLTYLALRAFEYESQQSLPLGSSILAARVPGPLNAALLALEQRIAPMQGVLGYIHGEFAPVMSLRDEILGLGTGFAPPGFPNLTPIESLRAFLKSDAAKIYIDGVYRGRGIRFALRPPPWAEISCAERIWRITTGLVVDGFPVNNARMMLMMENSFGSQRCRFNEQEDLFIARIRPEHNLLVGDDGNYDDGSFVQPSRYSEMGVTGLPNASRESMEALPEGAHAGFAGRGLYANYILIFPPLQFDNESFLSRVKDVLFRFDIVEVTRNLPDPE